MQTGTQVDYGKVRELSRGQDPLAYSMRRAFVDAFFTSNSELIASARHILDLGGEKGVAKRGLFKIEELNARVVALNISRNKAIDVEGDGARLPVQSASFDLVICAETLEHVPDPISVLNEIYRALDKGGSLLATVPFNFRIHGDPHDYGRYTEHYFAEALVKIGFSEFEVVKQGFFWSVLADMAREYARHQALKGKPKRRFMRNWMSNLVGRAKQKALRLEESGNASGNLLAYTTGFQITAIK